MRQQFLVTILTLAVVITTGCSAPKGDTIAEKQASVARMHDATLARLYREQPGAVDHVQNAPGYGVFSNIKTNFIWTTGGNGYGIVTDNRTGDQIYMRMAQAGVGIGLGIKEFRGVFVFNNEDVMHKFVNSGWEFGVGADAAAQGSDVGGAVGGAGTFNEGMTVYQLTEAGLVAQASVAGTKYWKDKALNGGE